MAGQKKHLKSKEWLIEVAKTVERNTNMFNKQLKIVRIN